MTDTAAPRIGSLCSGYGGLDLGLMAVVGGSVAWHVEFDKHPSAVLNARFPGVPNYGDLTTTDWSQVESVDWLTAGYPCQPFSHAGKRKGKDDERHLWPFVADAIGVLRPGRVLLENVAGHVSLGLDAVLWDLAALGYDTTWGVVRAADAGAPHNRARIFIVAADTQCADRRAATGLSGEGGRHLGTPGRVEGATTPSGDSTAVANASGLGRGSGAGLREGEPRRIGRGRPDHNDGEAPADATGDGRDEGRPEPARLIGRSDVAVSCPGVRHCKAAMAGGGACDSWCPVADTEGQRRAVITQGDDAAALVGAGSGTGARAGSRRASEGVGELDGSAGVEWGSYRPAIRRWEHVTGRPAPRPTEPGRTGERLSPRFVEWLMGLPDGWVTDVLPRNPALKALGNGVVPQQAALAVGTLLQLQAVAA